MKLTQPDPRTTRLMTRITSCGVLAISLLMSATARADWQSPEDILQAARTFVSQQQPWQTLETEISVRALDSRLRLARCGQPLEAFISPHARVRANTTVGVRCGGPSPWQIFVPVQVAAYDQVLVSRHALPRGSVISPAVVQVERRDVAALVQGYLPAVRQDQPVRLRHAVAMGAVISPNAVEPDAAIRRGQQVRLVSQDDRFQISMTGIALGEAAAGARLQVRNLSSGRVVEGIAEDAQQVRIP